MTAQTPLLVRRLELASRWVLLLGGLVSLAGGAALIIPWLMGLRGNVLLDDIPLPLTFGSGITFVLLGTALGSHVAGWVRPSRSLAGLCLAGALLGMWQALLLWPTNFDQSLLDTGAGMDTPTPFLAVFGGLGALGLCALGLIALTVPNSSRILAVTVAVGAVVGALSSVVLAAYGVAVMMRGPDAFWLLSVVLSVSLLMCGAGLAGEALALARRLEGIWPGWLPLPVVAACLTMSLSLWLALLWSEDRRLIESTDAAAGYFATSLAAEIQREHRSLKALLLSSGNMLATPTEALGVRASLVMRFMPGCDAIYWFNDQGLPTWSYPPGGVLALSPIEGGRNELKPLLEGGSHVAALSPRHGDATWIALVEPGELPDGRTGHLVAVVRTSVVMHEVFEEARLGSFTVEVCDGHEAIFTLNESLPGRASWVRETQLRPGMPAWRLRVWPTEELIKAERSALPLAVLGLGTALSLLLGVAVSLVQQAHRRAQQLGVIKQGLEREVLERLRAEKSQHRLLQILEASTDYISMADADGRVLYLNGAARNALGVRRNDPLDGRRLDDAHTPEAARRIREEAIPRARAEGSWQGETTLRTAEGIIEASEIILAHYNRHGDVEYLSSVARDIADVKAAEQEQRRLQEKLLHAQRMESLGVLAGGIAHDFNNLLAAIIGNIELALNESSEDHPAHHFLTQARVSGMRASDLTRQMLAYSGKGRFSLVAVNVNRLIGETVELLRATLPKRVELSRRLAADLPPVSGDASQLQQIVVNLVTNAAEAVGEEGGKVEITTRIVDLTESFSRHHPSAERRLTPGRYVELRVHDNGQGMDAATMEKIFDPFFTTKFTGRGLGLAAVLGIVRGHDGTISVESEKGRGTSFLVLLPARQEAPAEGAPATALEDEHTVPLQPPAPEPAKKPAPKAWKGHGLVLVAEDEDVVRDLTAQVLEAHGFTVLTAEDGEEAVERFRDNAGSVAAVLLDDQMPVLEGPEALKAMRVIQPGVPAMLTSGLPDAQKAAKEANASGPTRFLAKPYAPSDLIREMRELLQASKP